MAELAQQPEQWPAQVTVTSAAKATVIRNGQPAGMMLVGAGKQLTVTAIAADGVTGKFGSSTVKVAVKQTDLLKKLEEASITIEEPEPAAEEAAPAPAAPPKKVEPAPPKKAAPAAPKAAAASASSAMQRLFNGKLVRFAGGKMQPLAPTELTGIKYYALYFSASWCGPCRQFTPGFVDAYRELKQTYPEFEVIFVSADHSAGDMQGYMRDDKMAWPAVQYDRREQKMVQYSGPGIPCLVLVDAQGRVLSDSYNGDDYVGPQHVLAETRQILKKNHGG
jgi:nucleoredoxin